MGADGSLRVLVVEDEMIIAMELEAQLQDLGHDVIGPFPTVRRALSGLTQETPDAALLDVNVGGELVTPVAQALAVAQVPYVLLTGYTGRQLTEPVLRNAPRLGKPLDPMQLAAMMERLATSHA